MQRAFNQLEPAERLIVRECLVEGGSSQELARALGVNRNALYQRLSRAKKRLKEILEKEGVLSRAERSSPRRDSGRR